MQAVAVLVLFFGHAVQCALATAEGEEMSPLIIAVNILASEALGPKYGVTIRTKQFPCFTFKL